jgi:hypothetical protein
MSALFSASLSLALAALVAFGEQAYAQAGGQEQIVKEGKKYMYEGKQLKSPSDLKQVVAGDPEAVAEAGKAGTYMTWAYVSGAVGGTLIGWPVGQAIGGSDETQWALAAVGAGVVGVAIVCGVSSDKHFKKAVDLYNASAVPISLLGLRPQLAAGPGRVALIARF